MSGESQGVTPRASTLRLHPLDDVVIAKVPLAAGTVVETEAGPVRLDQPVGAGHKIAFRARAPGQPVHRYGQVIGVAFDGFGLDIEAQILDPPGARNQALLELSQQIRTQAPSFPLAAVTPSPVALQTPPNGWPDFPWEGLNQYYDAFVPMDYFASRAHGLEQVQNYIVLSAEIIRGATGDASVPIAPIGGIAQAVSGPEAEGFVAAIQQEGLLGGSLYDFRTTTDPSVWAALKQLG